MSRLSDIRAVSSKLSTPQLLHYVIAERFPGKTAVTASLRAKSIVVLSMVADVNPATPVVFCRPGHLFKESFEYRERIVDALGLTNVSESEGQETELQAGDREHCERMWSESENAPGRTFEIVHLNETLKPYACWISAVYHMSRPSNVRQRVDVEGNLIRIDPLVSWSSEDVHHYLSERSLPLHPRVRRDKKTKPRRVRTSVPPSYHF